MSNVLSASSVMDGPFIRSSLKEINSSAEKLLSVPEKEWTDAVAVPELVGKVENVVKS